MPGTPGARVNVSQQTQRARAQQAVLDKLRRGGVITGAQPANPIIGGIQALFGGAGKGAIPPLGAATLGGQEVLMSRGGWDTRRAGSGPINVGGQTWYPAQSGQDLVYKRAPGQVGGQYGSIVSRDQFAPLAAADSATPPPPNSPAAERAYQSEKSRVAQLTAQDPELQRYEAARLKAVAPGATPESVQAAEDIGMQIWAQKYGKTLAPKVKPGQAGYQTIQNVLSTGQMGAPLELPFDTSNLLGGTPMPQGLSYGTEKPVSIPGGTPVKGGGFPAAPAAMFERFLQTQPSLTAANLQASPLGTAQPLDSFSYGGNVQPIGTAMSSDFYGTEKARELARLFANAGIVK